MRSLSILLLDKNTQGVNGHGLVGGLLGNPLGFKRTLKASDDLNNIEDGEYSYVNDDNPSNIYGGGTNTLLIQMTTYNRQDIWQIAFCANDRKVGIRLKYAGVWRQWKDIVTGL